MTKIDAPVVELSPCPFCGGEAELIETIGSQASAFSPYFRVTCAECGVYQDQWDERKPAITAWNTRHCPDPVASAEADLLGAAIEAIRKAKSELLNGNGEVMSIIAAMSHLDAILSQVREVRG